MSMKVYNTAYVVPFSIEVLSTRIYNRLHKCIEDISKKTVLAGEE
jgi:hypothetical protein